MSAAGMVAWRDGTLVPPDAPLLPINDHGVLVGDGVFETIKVLDGLPFATRRHLDRLRRSADGLGLCIDFDLVRSGIADVLAAPDAPGGLARLRITVTGGPSPLSSDRGDDRPTVLIALGPAPPQADAADVVVAPWPRNERGAAAGLKTISYAENVVALRWARAQGASEALLANTRGELCEGTGSNVFAAIAGRLVTPPLTSGCLAGVTRDLLLEWTDAVEETLPIDALREATEVFLSSSLRDIQPVRAVDGVAFDEVPGPLTRAAHALFLERAAHNQDP